AIDVGRVVVVVVLLLESDLEGQAVATAEGVADLVGGGAAAIVLLDRHGAVIKRIIETDEQAAEFHIGIDDIQRGAVAEPIDAVIIIKASVGVIALGIGTGGRAFETDEAAERAVFGLGTGVDIDAGD